MPREPGSGKETPAPVFVDRTGRRRRRIVAAGAALAAVLAASLTLLLAGFFTGGVPPLPGWPDPPARRAGEGRSGNEPAGVTPTTSPPTAQEGGSTGPAPGPPPAPPAATSGPPAATVTPSPSPTAVNRPGQGDEHRNNPHPDRTVWPPRKPK